jgi:hypothetical protein
MNLNNGDVNSDQIPTERQFHDLVIGIVDSSRGIL